MNFHKALFIILLITNNTLSSINETDLIKVPLILKQAFIDSMNYENEEKIKTIKKIIKKAHQKISHLPRVDIEILDNKRRQELIKRGNLDSVQFLLSWATHEINIEKSLINLSHKRFEKQNLIPALIRILYESQIELKTLIEELTKLNISIHEDENPYFK